MPRSQRYCVPCWPPIAPLPCQVTSWLWASPNASKDKSHNKATFVRQNCVISGRGMCASCFLGRSTGRPLSSSLDEGLVMLHSGCFGYNRKAGQGASQQVQVGGVWPEDYCSFCSCTCGVAWGVDMRDSQPKCPKPCHTLAPFFRSVLHRRISYCPT